MDIQKFQSSANIVVVDDVESEGMEVVDALKSIRIPSAFYLVESDDDLPRESLGNLRVIFFDLHYSESNALYPDTVRATIALNKLQKFVGKHSFYALVVWSSNSDQPVYEEFIRQLERQADFAKPVKFFSMNKMACRRNPQAVIDLINEGFQSIPLFELFLTWERLVSNAVTRSLTDLIGRKENGELSKLLNTLASALGGDHPDKTTPKQALYALNSILEDNVGQELELGKFGLIHRKISSGILSDSEKAVLNVAMVFDSYSGTEGSGSAYKRKVLKAKRSGAIQEMLDTPLEDIGTQLAKIEMLYVDVTPLCDSATGKGNRYYVEGIIHPRCFIKTGSTKARDIRVKTFCYTLAKTFSVESEECCFTVNLRSYASDSPAISKMQTPHIKFRDNIVVDIQHKIAEYISRPGHIWL